MYNIYYQDNCAILKFYSLDQKEIFCLEINSNIKFSFEEGKIIIIEKIISWYDEKSNIDMALSFQSVDTAEQLQYLNSYYSDFIIKIMHLNFFYFRTFIILIEMKFKS